MTKIVLLALVALSMAACTPGAAPRATPAASPTEQGPTAVPTTTSPSTASTAPLPTAALASPPIAILSGGDVGTVAGALGSVIWNGLTSDTPWVVTPNGMAVNSGTPLMVATAGAAADRWAASWAPVSGNQAGQPQSGGSSPSGAPIRVSAPTAAGSWSLRLEAWFGSYNSVTWYWRLEVSP